MYRKPRPSSPRHAEVVEEHLGRGVVHHRPDRADGEAIAHRLAHVDKDHRQPVRLLHSVLERRRPGEEEHEVGMLRPARPDLLPVDDEVVALPPRGRPERAGVRAARGLRHPERLQAQQKRAHRVHLRMAGAPVAARALHLLEHGGGGGQRQAPAAVRLGDEDGEPAGLGQRLHKGRRVGHLTIEPAPVVPRKPRAELRHRLTDLGIGLWGGAHPVLRAVSGDMPEARAPHNGKSEWAAGRCRWPCRAKWVSRAGRRAAIAAADSTVRRTN